MVSRPKRSAPRPVGAQFVCIRRPLLFSGGITSSRDTKATTPCEDALIQASAAASPRWPISGLRLRSLADAAPIQVAKQFPSSSSGKCP